MLSSFLHLASFLCCFGICSTSKNAFLNVSLEKLECQNPCFCCFLFICYRGQASHMLIKVYKTSKLLVWTHWLLACIIMLMLWSLVEMAPLLFWLKLLSAVLEVQDRSSSGRKEDGEAQQHLFCSHDSWAWWYHALFSPGFTITEDKALNFITSLTWVPILWIV